MLHPRCFPSFYSGGQKRKRKSADPPRVSVVRFMELQFCLQLVNTDKTPKDEAVLLQAGLGRRTINLADGADHTEVSLKDKSTINSEDIIEVFHLTFQIT